MKFKSIKGTKDILPAESHQWQSVERAIRDVMHAFNYKEIRTPVFEETGLFARSIGELTDIVGKEMYTFEDRSGTSLTLKPEMTAPVIRAYIQHNLGEQQPLTKVYYIAPMFRQERPQAGRLRQFHQFGAEAIGGQQPVIDAEIIALTVEVYNSLGVSDHELRINSVGCENCRPLYKEKLRKFLRPKLSHLSPESQKRFEQNPLRILDSKDEADREQVKDAPLMIDHLCGECKTHFEELQKALKAFSIAYSVDGRIVRGLDYYTKTAFELISRDLGSQDALAGGGRYDLLVKELGGKQTPAVGVAAGMERLLMVMDAKKKLSTAGVNPSVFLVAADEGARGEAARLALLLRRRGVPSDFDALNRSLKAQMREAHRQQSSYVVVIGERELKEQAVNVKNMRTGSEEKILLGVLQDYFQRP